MDQSANNPATNTLGQGLPEEVITEAVRKSGYPLQRIVAGELKDRFVVTEEWSYIDRATKEQRALDLFAYRQLSPSAGSNPVEPALILLVECKRADLPHVFFRTAVPSRLGEFPRVLGLPRRRVTLKEGAKARSVPIAGVLGLHEEAFVREGPPLCTSFSQAVRKGKRLALSGAAPFNRIFLPLISALVHATDYYDPGSSERDSYYADLVFCIAVIDGPMIVAESDPERPGLSLQPWVRVSRHEVSMADRVGHRDTHYGIDVVHRDYFARFVSDHLLPFAEVFAQRVVGKPDLLRAGEVTVPNLDGWTWESLKPNPRRPRR